MAVTLSQSSPRTGGCRKATGGKTVWRKLANLPYDCLPPRTSCRPPVRGALSQYGFTLLELLVVIAVIALGTAGVALAMRDSGQTLVEREATRLAALLDAARSQSRATGRMVTWTVTLDDKNQSVMRWSGLRHKEPLPTNWLSPLTQAVDAKPLILGPDPVIAPQRLRLAIGKDTRDVVTDGVGVFAVETPDKP